MTPHPARDTVGDSTRLTLNVEADKAQMTGPPAAVNGHRERNSAKAPVRRRLVIAGTPATVIEALAVALNAPNDLEVVGVASTGNGMFRFVERHQPDALVVYAPHMSPEIIESATRIKRVFTRVGIVFLTERPTVPVLCHSAAAGVAACLPLDSGLGDLIGAIRADRTDTMLVGKSSLATTGPIPNRLPAIAPVVLTRRELEVLSLLAEGQRPPAIAVRLVVSIYTARGHVKNVLRKLGAHSQLEAVAIATRIGLLARHDSPTGWNGS
jgi:DNA-binding NarL/FixJ family response regulator